MDSHPDDKHLDDKGAGSSFELPCAKGAGADWGGIVLSNGVGGEASNVTIIISWAVGVTVNVSLLALLAWTQSYYLHLCIAAAIPTAIAQSYWQGASGGGARPGDISGKAVDALRHIAGVWSWGALALIVTYASSILTWREYGRFVVVFTLLASGSLVLASLLTKPGSALRQDDRLPNVARIVALVTCAALAIVAIGLLVHDGRGFRFGGKVVNAQLAVIQRDGWQDWAANHVFFYGAIAVSVIAWKAMRDFRSEAR